MLYILRISTFKTSYTRLPESSLVFRPIPVEVVDRVPELASRLKHGEAVGVAKRWNSDLLIERLIVQLGKRA